MKKILFFLLSVLIFSSCNVEPAVNYRVDDRAYEISTSPVLVIKSEEILNFKKLYLPFIHQTLSEFSRFGKPEKDSIYIDLTSFEWDMYDLFFLIGEQYFQEYKNQALVIGMLQDIWINMTLTEKFQNSFDSLGFDPYFYLSGIQDIHSLLVSKKMEKTDYQSYYHYVNSYLLEQILFVSVQEIMERPYRYFHGEFYKDMFTHAVILPEMTSYYSYLMTLYGKRRLIKIMKTEYTKENWFKIFREEVNETENGFRVKIEKAETTQMYRDEAFTKKLDLLLKLYNTTTKKTLFRK